MRRILCTMLLLGALASPATALPLLEVPEPQPWEWLTADLRRELVAELAPRLAARPGTGSARLTLRFDRDPRAAYVRLTDRAGRYQAMAVALVRLELPGVAPLELVLPWHGDSEANAMEAEARARTIFLADCLPRLRERFPLAAMLIARQGRWAVVQPGSEAGLRVDMWFGASGSAGPVGRLRLDAVGPLEARAEVLEGQEAFVPGTPLVELPGGGWPATVGAIAQLVDGEHRLGLALGYRQTGRGWTAGLDLGSVDRGRTRGMGLQAHGGLQHELWPEHAWLELQGGGATAWLTQDLPGSSEHAGAMALHGLLGVLLHLRWGWLQGAVGLRYLTPWTAAQWNQTTGLSTPVDVSAQVEHPTLGGLGLVLQLGLGL